jgi:hypothetical protein
MFHEIDRTGANERRLFMKRCIGIFGLIGMILYFVSCGTQTKPLHTWKDSSYTGGYLTSVMVVAISDKLADRTMFEDLFAKAFDKNGVKAVSAIAIAPGKTEIDKETIKAEAKKRGIEAVFVTHLMGVKEKTVYHPPPVGAHPYYGSFSSYYPSVYSYTHYPGYYTQHELVRLESNLYEVATEKLIWSFQSETINPKNIKDGVDSLGKVVISDLRKNSLLK